MGKNQFGEAPEEGIGREEAGDQYYKCYKGLPNREVLVD